MDIRKAAVLGSRMRFRAVMMTSFGAASPRTKGKRDLRGAAARS
jgi:hypothetical protein